MREELWWVIGSFVLMCIFTIYVTKKYDKLLNVKTELFIMMLSVLSTFSMYVLTLILISLFGNTPIYENIKYILSIITSFIILAGLVYWKQEKIKQKFGIDSYKKCFLEFICIGGATLFFAGILGILFQEIPVSEDLYKNILNAFDFEESKMQYQLIIGFNLVISLSGLGYLCLALLVGTKFTKLKIFK